MKSAVATCPLLVPGSSLQDHIGSSWLIFPAKTLSLGFSLLLDGNGISWDMKTLKIPLEILDICVARKEPQVFFSVIFPFFIEVR